MFDSKFAYKIGAPLKKCQNEYDSKGITRLYKVKTYQNKPYFIQVDEFHNNVCFIKFFPTELENRKNKYKFRFESSENKESLPRLVSTCIELAKNELLKDPTKVFAFYGEWDMVDVERKSSISQRYRIYQRIVASKMPKSKFRHLAIEGLNVYAIIPRSIYKEGLKQALLNYFDAIFGEILLKLQIPIETEETTEQEVGLSNDL